MLGLYIGWRGQSLPDGLNYLTFWGRKSAAETVGDGDLREFLWKLQKLYMARNTSKDTFMGLVTVGHSFGGQVVFKAVTETFERDLLDVIDHAKGTGKSEGKHQAKEIVSGFGDMTVLINPALEAFQYERIHRLTQQLSFTQAQAPVLLVVSSENDWARQFWFQWGRMFTRPFRPSFPDDEQENLWLTALGEYRPQLTHDLKQSKAGQGITDSLCTVDLSSENTLGPGALVPISGLHQPYSPVVVAYTSSSLVDGHNGIFEKSFASFLTHYITHVEGKRICIRNTPS